MASTATRHHRPRTDADRKSRARTVRRSVIGGIIVVLVAFLVAILFTDDGDGPDDTLRQTGPVSIDGDAGQPNYPPSNWLERENWPFGTLLDSPTSEIARAFGVPAYPAFVVLDADGTVRLRTTGALTEEQLDILVEIAQS